MTPMRFARAVSLLTRLGWLLAAAAPAATTDGVATFTVTLSDPAGNYNRRVDAYWVTDSTGKFVQTVRKDAATRQTYLYQSWPPAAVGREWMVPAEPRSPPGALSR